MTIDEVYKKKLYSIFHMHGHIHNGEWAIAPSKEGALLDAIAQAHEQEVAILQKQLDICIDNSTEHEMQELYAKEQVATRQARVAVMAEALKAHDAWMKRIYPPSVFTGVSGDEGVVEVVALREQANQALQSAPKVLFYGTIQEGDEPIPDFDERLDQAIADGVTEVDVIVLERSVPETKSEQEEPCGT